MHYIFIQPVIACYISTQLIIYTFEKYAAKPLSTLFKTTSKAIFSSLPISPLSHSIFQTPLYKQCSLQYKRMFCTPIYTLCWRWSNEPNTFRCLCPLKLISKTLKQCLVLEPVVVERQHVSERLFPGDFEEPDGVASKHIFSFLDSLCPRSNQIQKNKNRVTPSHHPPQSNTT